MSIGGVKGGDNPLLPRSDQTPSSSSASQPTGGATPSLTPATDGFVGGPRPTPLAPSKSTATDPLESLRGDGRPTGPRGGATVPYLPTPQGAAVRVDRALYLAAHRNDRNVERPAIQNADTYRIAPGQGWMELVAQAYGPLLGDHADPATLRLLAEALAQQNGRSTLEAPPQLVAAPQLEDLNRILVHMRRDLDSRGEAVVRGAVTEYLGEEAPVARQPTQGAAYATRWNDTLRGVTLAAYGAYLAEAATPEEADLKLQRIMLAIARKNGLNSTDLADAGIIYLPKPREIRAALRAMEEEPSLLVALQGEAPGLTESIARTGNDAKSDLNQLQGTQPVAATPFADLAAAIDATDAAVRQARMQRAMAGTPGLGFFGMFSFNWLFEFWSEEPPAAGELPIRREGEELVAYLDRVAPGMPAEEYRKILANPGRFMMRNAGIINGNGDTDPERAAQFTAAMAELGLVDEAGSWAVTPRDGESLQQAVDRIAMEAMRRAGIPCEAGEGASFEASVRSAEGQVDARQRVLLQQLVLWNQLVPLSAEGTGGSAAGESGAAASVGASASYQGMLSALLAASSVGFAGAAAAESGACRRLDAAMKGAKGLDEDPFLIDADESLTEELNETLEEEAHEEAKEGDRVAQQGATQAATARGRQDLAAQQLDERHQARARRHLDDQEKILTERVRDEAVATNIESSRREARGEAVGGPGRKLPGDN